MCLAELTLLSISVLYKHTLAELCGFPGCRGYGIAGSVCVPQTFPTSFPSGDSRGAQTPLWKDSGLSGRAVPCCSLTLQCGAPSSTLPCELQPIPSLLSPGNRGCASPQEDFRSKVEDYIKRYAR